MATGESRPGTEVGAICMHSTYRRGTAKVIQVRGVSDETHDALARAAQTQGVSLSTYLRGELAALARRSEAVGHNAEVISAARAAIASRVDRETILEALREGRRG